MAKIYSTIRAGKTVRERLELLLEANPYDIGRVAPAIGIIDLVDEKKRITSVIHEPLVYNHQKPDEVREFFTALLEIFTADRTEAPENRRLKEEAEWHEVIDKLDERFILYKGKADNSINSDLTAIKATAKSDLDDILNVELKAYEQEFKSIGVNAFHSVIDRLDEVATYITDKLEELRQQKKREQIKSGLPPVERNLKILEPTQPDFIHRRFFQAFVGYKCEDLKQAIDDYKGHSENETLSLGAWPMSDEVLDQFREQKLSFKHLCLLCYAYNWNPRNYDSSKYSRIESAITPFLERAGRMGDRNNTGRLNRAKSRSEYTLQELAEWLDINQERTRDYAEKVVNLGITEEAKRRFNLFLRD